MSSNNTASDTMHKYETDQDSGDVSNASNDPQPSIEPLPDNSTNGDAPIPMSTPQSPIQTESDTAQTEDSPEAKEDNAPESRSNRSGHPADREYREV